MYSTTKQRGIATVDGERRLAVHVASATYLWDPATINTANRRPISMDQKDLLVFAAHETDSRPLRYKPIKVIDYKPSRPDGRVLAPPGSVMVYVAHRSTGLVRKIADIASSQSPADTEMAEYLYKQYEGRRLLSPHRAWRLLQSASVFASIRYGGSTLARNVVIPTGAEAVWVASPHNGGQLEPKELTLVEHFKEESSDALEAVALRHVAPLTPAERAALDAVPADQLELNLGAAGSCCDSVTDVLQVVIAATFAIMCGNPIPDPHISEQELVRLSPTATAIRLMQIRRDALGHEH